ncbi:MAG TPA: aminotransferase class III-fold pyridoxal phosphate-dependent enzyme [Gemmatimonadales bacterium]|nr:aminotransferase class III-fold pyridoxal phosphate-dependent enzyme [Gemmatimonadales bacterium]
MADLKKRTDAPAHGRTSSGATERPSDRASGALLATYAQFPVHPVRGEGSWLYEADGTAWLDAYGGHAVSSTGHCHPHVVAAIEEQAARLLFYSMAIALPQRERLADELAARCPGDLKRVFFCNSGAEANENALMIARKATGRRKVVSVTGGWHGRTVGVAAVTDGAKYEAPAVRAGLPLSVKVPFNDPSGFTGVVDESVAAVIVEPIQGMSGAKDCTPEFLAAARAACDRAGAVLIYDEIQCGVGRTGKFTAAESFGVVPDIITIAKGLASGIPIGATIITTRLAGQLGPGDLGSTFGGGPVPCAAALATLEVLDREGVYANVEQVGAQLVAGARALGAVKVWGRGLLLGLDFGRPAAEIQKALWGHRILVGTSGDPNVVRLLPPLTFTPREAELLLAGLKAVLG